MTKGVTWIEVFEGIDGKWYFHGKAKNGKIVADSQGYTRKWSAKRAARRVFGTSIGINESQEKHAV